MSGDVGLAGRCKNELFFVCNLHRYFSIGLLKFLKITGLCCVSEEHNEQTW